MASSFASPRSTEYCCAICIELLLRPVVLSCGHRLCRGCWVRLLQGSQARAVASRTGYAVCPLGRCEVRPCVPEIDLDLEAEMRKRIGFKQLAAHAAAAEDVSLAEESAAVAAVNAWAAAGCPLDAPEEIEADEQELAAAVAAAAAATLAVESLEREERKSLCASLLIVFTLASACATFGLFIWGWHQKIGVRGLPSHTRARAKHPLPVHHLICSSYLQPELSRLLVSNACATAVHLVSRVVFVELDRPSRGIGAPARRRPTRMTACLTLRAVQQKYSTWLLSVLLVIVACAALLCCCCCGLFRMTMNYGDSRSAAALTQQRRNLRAQTAPVEPQSVSESETQRLSAPESETVI